MASYCRPRTVSEVLAALASAEGHGRILVGGTDLLVHLRKDPFAPTVIVDIKSVNDFPPAVEIGDEAVRFGPTARMSEISGDPFIADRLPALSASARVVGSIAIRNRATLIGNICNGSPAADTAPALLVYGSTVTVTGPGGERTMPLVDFFVGPGETRCGPDEIVIRVDVPIPDREHRSAFQRLTRRRGVDLATVSVAAGVDADGGIVLGLGCVGPTPLLTDASLPVDLSDPDAIEGAVEELVSIATPISDVRAARDYREAMVRVLAVRAVQAAAAPPEGMSS
ncbi:FAD binding domain-containing protein [Candidatus Poriferisocius sp.]|uniref:FAD binding domain-containing protein n=1 Tax=Candidatus Poriferisocius sp. TaxID=3101276 RepID=UPI003B5B178C